MFSFTTNATIWVGLHERDVFFLCSNLNVMPFFIIYVNVETDFCVENTLKEINCFECYSFQNYYLSCVKSLVMSKYSPKTNEFDAL